MRKINSYTWIVSCWIEENLQRYEPEMERLLTTKGKEDEESICLYCTEVDSLGLKSKRDFDDHFPKDVSGVYKDLLNEACKAVDFKDASNAAASRMLGEDDGGKRFDYSLNPYEDYKDALKTLKLKGDRGYRNFLWNLSYKRNEGKRSLDYAYMVMKWLYFDLGEYSKLKRAMRKKKGFREKSLSQVIKGNIARNVPESLTGVYKKLFLTALDAVDFEKVAFECFC